MVGVRGLLPVLGAVTVLGFGLGGAAGAVEFDDTFNPVVVNGNNDKLLGYYVRYVRKADNALEAKAPASELRAVAEEWVEAKRSGALKQIYQGFHGQSLLEGPRGQMFQTCFELANTLTPSIQDLQRNGVKPQDLDDAILAMELLDTVRYAHQEVLFATSTYMGRPVRILKDYESMLTPEQKQRIEAIQNEDIRKERLTAMLDVQKQLKRQYELRYGREAMLSDELCSVVSMEKRTNTSASRFYGFEKEKSILASNSPKH